MDSSRFDGMAHFLLLVNSAYLRLRRVIFVSAANDRCSDYSVSQPTLLDEAAQTYSRPSLQCETAMIASQNAFRTNEIRDEPNRGDTAQDFSSEDETVMTEPT